MSDVDGAVPDPARQGDLLAIRDLAISYAHAVDDADWARFEALFVPDAVIDYRQSGGITGPPAEVAAWMPGAMSLFTWCMHSISTHEIRFTGPDTARGRVHIANRNGLEWEGEPEVLDVYGWYVDEYVRVGEGWRFAARTEKIAAMFGGRFAELVNKLAAKIVSEAEGQGDGQAGADEAGAS
ncbi:MAG: nuclear transport factor 2 family protein [Acidimicrobiales bacterium]